MKILLTGAFDFIGKSIQNGLKDHIVWILRYIIIDLFNSLNKSLKYKANLVAQFVALTLKMSRVCFSVLSSYFSIRLIRFALKKYLNKWIR